MKLDSMRRLSLVSLALLAAALVPACSSSSPTIPSGVTAAGLTVTVEPNPVIATQNPVTFVATATYKITLTETSGLGGQIQFVNGSVYEPGTGRLAALNYYDSKDLIVFVGRDRIEANGTMSITQTASYTLVGDAKAATLTVSAQMKDDRGNLVNTSALFAIE